MALYHSAKGSVNYTIVGNPTIVDGVMTYSNVENYVRTRQNFLSSYNDYEIVCKCAKRLSTEEIIYCMSTGNNGNLQARLLSNAFRFIPHTFSNYIEIKGTFATDVWYWFKVRRTGNTIYASYSTDGVSWSNEVSKTFTQLTTSSNWIAFGTRVVSDSSWNGTSIDLNETYIKVNGQPWFGVCPVEVQKHQFRGPVGYEVVGSPTIVDGVVSGFSSSDYLTIPSFNPGNNPWEIVLCINTPQESDMNSWQIAFGTKNANQKCVRIISGVTEGSKHFQVIFTGPSGQIGYIGTKTTTPIQPNTKTWIKTIFNGSVYKVYTSLNGSDYTEVSKSVTSSVSISSDNSEYCFGQGLSSSYASLPYKGSIDLNETYIKVNGKLWFYQPADTKYIVKDGKLVWADPRIYIDDNGTITYATQNIAPVPAGFTFGTTTTPSIGYVDMRTQEFTSAPQGATIGREE